MTHRHTLLVVTVAVAMLVSPTILAQETATATRNTTNESETAGMGAQLTAFTQSSSAAVNESVENGMWNAGFNQSNASDRARLVRDRTGTLEGRLDRLQRQNATLQERFENGSLPEPAYIAQQSRLSARIDALRTAINDTDAAAARAGVNDSRLDHLRRNASNLTGPEVSAIARGLGGGPPAERGPPADRGDGGPPENRTTGGERGPPENRATDGDPGGGPPENRATDGDPGGPPENRTQGGSSGAGGANATDGGASGTTDAGNGTDSASGGDGAGSSGSSDSSSGGSDGQSGGPDSSSGGSGGQSGGSGGPEGSGSGGGQGSGAPDRARN